MSARARGPRMRALLCTLLLASAASADSGKVGLTAGFDLSSGKYGLDEETEVLFLPLTFSYQTGPWTGRLTVSRLTVSGPAAVIGGGDQAVVTGEGRPVQRTESGLGDLVASVSYATQLSLLGRNFLDLTLKVKLPTADEDRGLGTGRTDYEVRADLFRSFGLWTPFLTLGYRVLGDAPGLVLDDGFVASVGADYRLAEDLNAGLLLDFREATSASVDPALELLPYLSWKLQEPLTLSAYATLGLSDGSPDRGIGMQLGYRFSR